MPSPIIHIIVPLAILLVLLKDDKYIKYSVFALFPDLDNFSGMHRALFHNIFIVIAISLLIYFIIKDEKVTAVIFIFMFSHIILDLFNGGASLFFPIYDKLICIESTVRIDSNGHLSFVFNMINNGGTGGMWSGGSGYLVDHVDSAILFMIAGLYLIRKRLCGLH